MHYLPDVLHTFKENLQLTKNITSRTLTHNKKKKRATKNPVINLLGLLTHEVILD
jgi:hypothetical protein